MAINPHELTQTIEKLLKEARIYDISCYGWLNADETDPEYIGYAMWLLGPPYQRDLMAWQADAAPAQVATPEEQRLMELGTDFVGLMQASRFSIGSALLHREEAAQVHIEPIPFEVHELAALGTLSMAADRLRDFLVATFLKEKPRPGHEMDLLRLALCSAKLNGFGKEVAEFDLTMNGVVSLKERRNTAVHKLALEAARIEKQLIEEEREAGRRHRRRPAASTVGAYDKIIEGAREYDRSRREAIDDRITQLRLGYENLIKSGEVTFRLESLYRQRRP